MRCLQGGLWDWGEKKKKVPIRSRDAKNANVGWVGENAWNPMAGVNVQKHCWWCAGHLWLATWIGSTHWTLLWDQVSRVSPASPCLAVRHLAFVRQSLALPFQGWLAARWPEGKVWFPPWPPGAERSCSILWTSIELPQHNWILAVLTVLFLSD